MNTKDLKLVDLVKGSKKQIQEIKKDDLVNLIFQNKELEEMSNLNDISQSLKELKDNVIQRILEENKRLRKRIDLLEESNSKQNTKIVHMEKDLYENAQYNRRNNIELFGICDEIDDDELEENVIKILNTIGVECSANDIEACHRLPSRRNTDKPKRVITRFVNRKVCEKALERRKSLKDIDLSDINLSLKDSRIFINDNLYPYYKGLLGKCRLLQLDRCIHSYWSWKGSIFYKLTENGRITKVTHEEDLFGSFNGFDFTKRRSVEIEVSENTN